MKEYRFHWQTWVGIGMLALMMLLSMFLPESQVQKKSGRSVMRIAAAKWALTVDEDDIDTSRMQLEEGKKIDNNRVVPVLRVWGWMIILPIMMVLVSITFMIARRRTLCALLITDGLAAVICEVIVWLYVPSKLFWEEGYKSTASVIVMILGIMITVYGILCIKLLSVKDSAAEASNVYDKVFDEKPNMPRHVRQETPKPVQMIGKIVGIQGEYTGQSLEIRGGEEIILGRDPKLCMLVFSNKKMSRRQCGIRYDPVNGYYQAIDYSSNGTTLSDGTLLTTSEYTPLTAGTILYMAGGQEAIKLL